MLKVSGIDADAHLHIFRVFKIIVNVRREDHFIGLHEKSGSLEANDQVFVRDHFGAAFANARAGRHRPDLGFPGGKAFGKSQFDFACALRAGIQPGSPESGVSEILAKGGFG